MNTMLPQEPPKMDSARRRWSWFAFATGLAIGIPLGVVGLVVLMQMLTVMTSP